MAAVEEFKLLDGTSIPWLGFGSGTGEAMSDFKDAAGKLALEAGIKHIDTAQAYGDDHQEEQIGQLLKTSSIPRENLYIVTKLSETKGYTVSVPLDQIENRIRASAEKLGGPPDLFLLHNPFVVGEAKALPDELKATWKIFETLKDEGVLKSIGVSNFRPQDFEAILEDCKYKPVCNQIEYHPYLIDQLQPLRDLQEKHYILTTSYGPMQPMIRNVGGPLPEVLEKIATRLSNEAGKPFEPASVLLKWCKANHIGAITTSSKKERIQGYAAIDTFPDLTPEEVEAISQAGRNCHYRYYNAHMVKDFPVPSGSKIMEGPASRAIYPTLQMINQNNNNTDRSFSPDRESYLSDTAVKIDYVIYKKKESLNLERRVNTIHC